MALNYDLTKKSQCHVCTFNKIDTNQHSNYTYSFVAMKHLHLNSGISPHMVGVSLRQSLIHPGFFILCDVQGVQ